MEFTIDYLHANLTDYSAERSTLHAQHGLNFIQQKGKHRHKTPKNLMGTSMKNLTKPKQFLQGHIPTMKVIKQNVKFHISSVRFDNKTRDT